MTTGERKVAQFLKREETLAKASSFSIGDLFNFYAITALTLTQRPWAHRSKKGPGRKHQQTTTLTKQEREALKG